MGYRKFTTNFKIPILTNKDKNKHTKGTYQKKYDRKSLENRMLNSGIKRENDE